MGLCGMLSACGCVYLFIYSFINSLLRPGPTQYNARRVVNCKIVRTETIRAAAPSGAPETFFPVQCAHCETEVGMLGEDHVYRLLHCLLGY